MEYYDSINSEEPCKYYTAKNAKLINHPEVEGLLDKIIGPKQSNAINLFNDLEISEERVIFDNTSSKDFDAKSNAFSNFDRTESKSVYKKNMKVR